MMRGQQGRRVRYAAMTAACLLASAAMVSCKKKQAQSFERPPAAVTTAQAVTKDVPVTSTRSASASPAKSSITPQVSGKITQLHFTDGADVKKGELLFTIDPRPYQAAPIRPRRIWAGRRRFELHEDPVEPGRDADPDQGGLAGGVRHAQERRRSRAGTGPAGRRGRRNAPEPRLLLDPVSHRRAHGPPARGQRQRRQGQRDSTPDGRAAGSDLRRLHGPAEPARLGAEEHEDGNPVGRGAAS